MTQKGSEYRLCPKTKKKAKGRALWVGIQRLFNKLVVQQQFKTLPEALAMPPETLKQLLNVGPKLSSFWFHSVF